MEYPNIDKSCIDSPRVIELLEQADKLLKELEEPTKEKTNE
jgi:hypothetical protein